MALEGKPCARGGFNRLPETSSRKLAGLATPVLNRLAGQYSTLKVGESSGRVFRLSYSRVVEMLECPRAESLRLMLAGVSASFSSYLRYAMKWARVAPSR